MNNPHRPLGGALALAGWLALATSLHAGFVLNPSFEQSYNATWPHYGPVEAWSGGSGTNLADGPFHNAGTPVTDGAKVAFQQGSGGLSQVVTGLTSGQTHWLQFFYDARSCCGGTIDVVAQWDGATLETISSVTPVAGGAGYRFKNIAFTPAGTSGTLRLGTLAAGDATALFDAVCLVPRDAGQVIVMNPSFEASGTPAAPGMLTSLAGWSSVGTVGVNDASGPYADNGAIPEQDHAAFIQGTGTLSQTVGGLVPGERYTVSFRYNARLGNAPHVRISANGAAIFDANVSPVAGSNAYRTGSAQFTAGGPTALIALEQIATGDQTLLLDDIRISGAVVTPPPNLKLAPAKLELGPGLRENVAVTVSAQRLENGASTVRLRVANPAVARFAAGDVDGIVTLTFPAGQGETTLTAEVEGLARGSSVVEVVDNGGHDGVDGAVRMDVVTSVVRNPSFEATPPPAGVGYGAAAAWLSSSIASTGVNTGTMPFFDNGRTPDRDQVAFIQGSSQSLSQVVTGLVPGKRHWLQAFYNVRNCCGGSMGVTVRLNGTDLAFVENIPPVGAGAPFHFLNVPFVPSATDGMVEFFTTASGDASLLLDGVCVVQREEGEVTVKNPSFEASGVPAGVGYAPNIAGWTALGGTGVNIDTVGPFSDNGFAGTQDRVAFLQQAGSLAQMIGDLTPGQPHTLYFAVNARNCCSPGDTAYHVLVDGLEILATTQPPVGAGVPYAAQWVTFTPAGTTAELKFEGMSSPGEDHSLLLDDVRIFHGIVGPGSDVPLRITALGGTAIDLHWAASAPASLRLQSSTTLAPDSWSDVVDVPFVDGDENHVLLVIDSGVKFFRLRP